VDGSICEGSEHERDRTWPSSTGYRQKQRDREFYVEVTFFALNNACTHEEGPLAEGEVLGHEVTCPWHGAKFDIRTGEVLDPPAYEDVARNNVRVTGTDIEVEV
jgi:nitrite reductase/ring-hydroxylating ferredoxin subunit